MNAAMTSLLTTALILGVVAGFLLERRLMLRDVKEERREWARERSELLNRIKPETAQIVDYTVPDADVQPPPMDADDQYWELQARN